MNSRYIIVNSLKSGTQISSRLKINIEDVLIIFAFVFVGLMLNDVVYSKLVIPFIIFNILVGAKMVSPSRYNPGKKYYKSLLIMLKADTYMYRPLKNISTNDLKNSLLEKLK